MSAVGFIGKMPGHGDFVEGGGAFETRRALLDWARGGLAAGRQARGPNAFVDDFLVMPIWRFALAPGLLTRAAAVGAICPSVDAVGRAFPLIIVAQMAGVVPAQAFAAHAAWFDDAQALLLEALAPDMTAADLEARLPAINPVGPSPQGAVDAVAAAPCEIPVDAFARPVSAPDDAAAIWTTLGRMDGAPYGFVGAPDAALFAALVGGAPQPAQTEERAS